MPREILTIAHDILTLYQRLQPKPDPSIARVVLAVERELQIPPEDEFIQGLRCPECRVKPTLSGTYYHEDGCSYQKDETCPICKKPLSECQLHIALERAGLQNQGENLYKDHIIRKMPLKTNFKEKHHEKDCYCDYYFDLTR